MSLYRQYRDLIPQDNERVFLTPSRHSGSPHLGLDLPSTSFRLWSGLPLKSDIAKEMTD
jgi:hypothetical protein